MVLVSHDRYFMDRVCRRITEVWNRNLTDYPCIYSRYLVEERRGCKVAGGEEEQDEAIGKMEDFISRFRYKATRPPLFRFPYQAARKGRKDSPSP